MDKLNLSLDEIIKRGKSSGNVRGRGRPGISQRKNVPQKRSAGAGDGPVFRKSVGNRTAAANRFSPYKRGNVERQWKHDMFEEDTDQYVHQRNGSVDNNGTKLLITNLEFGVSDCDLEELFVEFGPLAQAEVHYDRSGRSLGTANVTFKQKSSAIRAMNYYNGVPLDGRPMNIQLATEGSDQTATRFRRSSNGRNEDIGQPRTMKRVSSGGPRVGGRARGNFQRGGRSNRGRSSGSSNRRSDITAEQLDAELDDYVKKN